MNENTSYEQLKAIMKEIMTMQDYPNFDFINNVLSCKEILGDFELWYSWGKLLVVSPEDKGKMAGQLFELDDWNTENNGTITLIKKNKKGDEE